MAKEELKLKLDSGYELTGSKKQRLYKELLPMQSNIMHILLSDINRGTQLMQTYNALIQEFDKDGEVSADAMRKMVDLERQVLGTKKETSKAGMEAYANKCNELLSTLNEDSIEQSQRTFERLRNSFEERVGDFSLAEVNQMRNIFANVRFFIIRAKVKASPYLDLQSEISEEEVKELEGMFSYHAIQLCNSKKARESAIGGQIRDDIMLLDNSESSIVYDSSIWEKFGSMAMLPQDKEVITKNTREQTSSTSLAVVTKKASIWEKIRNAFKGLSGEKRGESKKGAQTEIERIAEEVVTQDMLDQYIDFSKPEEQRYIPDKRLPVYEFLRKQQEEQEKVIDETKKGTYHRLQEYEFTDEKELHFLIQLRQYQYFHEKNKMDLEATIISKALGARAVSTNELGITFAQDPITLMNFAKFLGIDKEIAQLIGNHYKYEAAHSGEYTTIKDRPKALIDLSQRLAKALREYKETQIDFYAAEDAKKQQAQTEKDRRAIFTGQFTAKVPGLLAETKEIGDTQTTEQTPQLPGTR